MNPIHNPVKLIILMPTILINIKYICSKVKRYIDDTID